MDGPDQAGRERARIADRAPHAALLAPTALRAVLEGLPDATVAADRDGRIVFANLLAEEQFGWRREELIGQHVSILWPERLRARYTRNMRLYFETDHPLRFTLRAYGVRRDGSEFVGEMSWGVVETDGGPLLLAIGRDISERQAADARARRQSRQQAAVAALGERALAGADLADLAAEAVEQMQETLPVLAVEVHRSGESVPLAAWSQAPPQGAPVVVDIHTGEEHFGTLTVHPVNGLGEDEQSFLRAVANVLATALGRLRDEERTRHEALHDPLTGLANRTLCHDRLTHALARSGRTPAVACVLFIDLDNFKRVNDLYGHAAGDALLVALSRRLVTTVRPADTVARLGGDEFVVVCEEVDEAVAVALGARLDGGDPRAARGRGRRAPAVGEHRDRARRQRAHEPGRAAGRRGRRRLPRQGRGPQPHRGVRRTPAPPRARAPAHRCRARARTLPRRSCGSAFQPIVALAGGDVVGYEALLRWDRPGGGLSSPADFIPVAEESSLIVEIGGWVLPARPARRAPAPTAPTRADRRSGSTSPAATLAQPDLPELVAECLQDSGLPASRLRLELTETVLVHAPATGVRNLDELKRLGAGLILDDFGTGYSSLGHLRDFPVDGVKIDHSFVADLGGQRRRHRDRRRDRLARRRARPRRGGQGLEEARRGGPAARARLPVRPGLPVRRARPANGVKRGPQPEEEPVGRHRGARRLKQHDPRRRRPDLLERVAVQIAHDAEERIGRHLVPRAHRRLPPARVVGAAARRSAVPRESRRWSRLPAASPAPAARCGSPARAGRRRSRRAGRTRRPRPSPPGCRRRPRRCRSSRRGPRRPPTGARRTASRRPARAPVIAPRRPTRRRSRTAPGPRPCRRRAGR